jgi:CheY-like chemotaxis protein
LSFCRFRKAAFLGVDFGVFPSLLITDDDRAFRETLCGVFQPRGFHVYSAGDGEEALEILGQRDIHLVLLDMHMPRLSGLETIRRVKQIRSRLPCILLSARMDEVLAQQARLADAFSVLAKPVSCAAITNTVEQALRRIYNWPEGNCLSVD